MHELYHIEHHHTDFEEGGRAVDQIELETHKNSTKKIAVCRYCVGILP